MTPRRTTRIQMHALLKRFAGRFALTLTLVVVEAAGWVLFPLVIGRAIDSVLASSARGLYELAILGVATMGIAVVRRLVDSRAYGGIYATLGEEMVEAAEGTSTSTRTARLGHPLRPHQQADHPVQPGAQRRARTAG